MLSPRALLRISICLACLVGSVASAADIELVTGGGDQYQRDLLEQTERIEHLEVDPHPDGKKIERIEIVPYDVFMAQDPWPRFFNIFHVTTLPQVVERELLFKAGDIWAEKSPSLIQETARNLRSNLFVSVARIVPCKGSTSDQVIALVVTKDIWSLRLDSDFVLVGPILQNLQLRLTESNLLGRMKQVIADFEMDPATFTFGEEYDDPRIWGGDLAFTEKADVISNRSTGLTEGAIASVALSKPLRTAETQWSWTLGLNYRQDVSRIFTNGAIYDYPSPVTGELIPFAFDRQLVDATASLTRSFGSEHKQDISVGWAPYVHQFAMPSGLTVSAPALADFENSFLPYSENANVVYVSYRNYQTKFIEAVDLNTFALTEDHRLGVDWTVQSNFASPALGFWGFTSTYWEPLTTVSSFFPLGPKGEDDLTVSAEFRIRYEPGFLTDSPWIDRLGFIQVKNYSPRFLKPLGDLRLVTSLRYTRRTDDVLKTVDELGGDNYVRGYPIAYWVGSQSLIGNVELRTLPVVLATIHVGAAAFFDCGDAFDSPSDFTLHESAGFGFRVLLPQFNRAVIRLDFAFPFEPIASGATATFFTAQFGQAF